MDYLFTLELALAHNKRFYFTFSLKNQCSIYDLFLKFVTNFLCKEIFHSVQTLMHIKISYNSIVFWLLVYLKENLSDKEISKM